MNNSWTCPPSEGCAREHLAARSSRTRRPPASSWRPPQGTVGRTAAAVQDPPAIYAASYSTGALTTGTNLVVGFSSRGPVMVDGSGRIKPDIVAPGAETRSSTNASDTSYASFQGTSMAGPHVVGVVALLWQAVPSLSRDIAATKARLNGTANPNITAATQRGCGGVGSDPEQPLRARARGRPRGRPGRRAASALRLRRHRLRHLHPPPPPPPGNWVNVAPLPQSVFGGAAATDGTFVYVFGGYHFPADARLDPEHGLPLQHRDRHVDELSTHRCRRRRSWPRPSTTRRRTRSTSSAARRGRRTRSSSTT